MGLYVLEDGTLLRNVHDFDDCKGNACPIHVPSDHPLSDAPRAWDSQLRIVQRMCSHGVYHPDFDALTYRLASTGEVACRHRCCESACCGIPEDLYFSEDEIA